MNIQKRNAPPVMGNFFVALAEAAKEVFSPKGGQVITVPGAPAALSMATVGVLAGVVVLAIAMKKKKVI